MNKSATQNKNQNMPMITIGITCFNAEDSIEKAVNSALAQDWPNKEILIVDDCSTDGSVSVVHDVIGDHENATLLEHKTNTGPGGARQTIVESAKGEFIAFFDDDDQSAPHRIRTQYEAIDAYEKDIAGNHPAPLIACYASGKRVYDNDYTLPIIAIGSQPKIPHGNEVADYLLFFRKKNDVFYGAGTPTCALMVRKNVVAQVGGFDGSFRRVEDVDFAIRLSLAGGYFIGTQEPLYTQQATHAADKAPEKNMEAETALAEKYKDYLDSVGRYYYAKTWPRVRYYHFKRQYGHMAFALLGLFLRAPVKVTAHLFSTGPKRLMHERRMNKKRGATS